MVLKNYFTKSLNKENIAILEIGSSKIVCLIAKVTDGKIEVIGHGCHSANGFKNCNINDPKFAKFSIIAAVDQAERSAGIVIENVILVLNGNKISSRYLTVSRNLKKQKVSEYDINELTKDGIKKLEALGQEVIHYLPLEYKVDGNIGIKDPCGLIGKQVSANIHFVTIPSVLLENIVNCLAECQLNIEDCVFAPFSSAIATLSDGEKELGATVIDLGDGVTSYSMFSQNNMVNCGSIPIGSRSITNDIAKSFMLDLSNAERIKTIHGSASVSYADNQKMIKTNDNSLTGLLDSEERNISNAELNEVINARIVEILKLLKKVLDEQYKTFPNSKHNIILTGGGSMLTSIADETAKIFAAKPRVKKPPILNGIKQDFAISSYTAAIGALQYALNYHSNTKEFSKFPLLAKIIKWLEYKF